jgi:hypothetical protein
MKSLLCVAIAVAACRPLVAQDRLAITFVHIVPDANARRIEATLSNKQIFSGTAAEISWNSVNPVRLPLNLRGDVDFVINGMRIRADEVVIETSGEIKPSGNVRIAPLR